MRRSRGPSSRGTNSATPISNNRITRTAGPATSTPIRAGLGPPKASTALQGTSSTSTSNNHIPKMPTPLGRGHKMIETHKNLEKKKAFFADLDLTDVTFDSSLGSFTDTFKHVKKEGKTPIRPTSTASTLSNTVRPAISPLLMEEEEDFDLMLDDDLDMDGFDLGEGTSKNSNNENKNLNNDTNNSKNDSNNSNNDNKNDNILNNGGKASKLKVDEMLADLDDFEDDDFGDMSDIELDDLDEMVDNLAKKKAAKFVDRDKTCHVFRTAAGSDIIITEGQRKTANELFKPLFVLTCQELALYVDSLKKDPNFTLGDDPESAL